MKVYVEFVILDNMIIDTLLLVFTALTLKKPVQISRITVASAVGTIATIVYSFLTLSPPIALFAKIALGIIMCLIAEKFLTLREFVTHFLVFTAYTFIMGGAIIALLYLLCADVVNALTFNYTYGVPVGVIFGGAMLAVFLAIKVVKILYRKKTLSVSKLCRISVTFDREYTLTALVDSGNLVTFNEKPVIFAVSKPFKRAVIEKYSSNILQAPLLNARITYSTINGEAASLAVFCSGVTVEGKTVSCYVAIGMIDAVDYDVIIGEGL